MESLAAASPAAAMSVTGHSDRHVVVDPSENTVSDHDERTAIGRRALVALLADGQHLLPGGIVERRMRCGEPNCRCAADPTQLHGPYHQWGYTKGGRRYTRRLTDEQLRRYGPEIERGRQLAQLPGELDDAELSRVERTEGWGT